MTKRKVEQNDAGTKGGHRRDAGLYAGFSAAELGDCRGYRSPGHSARTEAATEVLDPLLVRAVALTDGNTWVLLVLADVIALDEEIVGRLEDAVQRAAEKAGFPEVEVVFGATHTHTGPPVFTLGEVIAVEKVRDDLVSTSVRVAREALDSLVPLQKLTIQRGTHTCAVNRRMLRDGIVTMEPNPDGPVDPVVPVLSFYTDRGVIGRVGVLPMHPTVLSPGLAVLSGDVAGAISRMLEEGDEAPALTFQGASGDVRPFIVDDEGAFSGGTVDDLRRIADEIFRGITGSEENVLWAGSGSGPASMAFVRETITFHFLVDTSSASASVSSIATSLAVLALGRQLAFVFLPGEPFAELADLIRKDSPFLHTVVAAHTDATVGYIPTAEASRLGGYEVNEAYRFYAFPGPLDSGSADHLLKRVNDLLLKLYTSYERL